MMYKTPQMIPERELAPRIADKVGDVHIRQCTWLVEDPMQ